MPKNHHLYRRWLGRGAPPATVSRKIWRSQHRITFCDMADFEEYNNPLELAPTIYVEPAFTKFRKHPAVRQFVSDFWNWNAKVLWLVNSTSHPYIDMQRKLAALIGNQTGRYIVDLGSGSCEFMARLLSHNGTSIKRVYAVDIDWQALEKAPYVLKEAGYTGKVALIQGWTLSELPIWSGRIDTVVSSLGGLTYAGWTFDSEVEFNPDHSTPKQAAQAIVCQRHESLVKCLLDINRILKLNGLLAFSAPCPDPDWGKVLNSSLSYLAKNFRLRQLYKAIRYGVPAKKASRFMNQLQADGRAHYLTLEAWNQVLVETGFEIIESSAGQCYAGQGTLVLARKVEEMGPGPESTREDD